MTRGGAPGATAPDDDNPFDVDTAALQKAVPVSPRPMKGRTVEVVCPMCETKGFIAPQHQGKLVRCASAECKFPNFTAPVPKKEVVDESAGKSKGLTTGMLAGIGTGVAAVLAIGAFFLFRSKPQEVALDTVVPVAPTPKVELPKNAPALQQRQTLSTIPEILKASLDDVKRAAAVRDNNPNRARGRKWAAEAFAASGDIKEAREQLQALMALSAAPGYYQIEPLVTLYLQQRAAGKVEPALLDEALKHARVPDSARGPVDAISALAAALVLDGRPEKAAELLKTPIQGPRATASLLWMAASYGRVFDYEAVASVPAFLASNHPQWIAATWIVASEGDKAGALKWAQSATAADVREGGLAVWGARVARDAASLSAVTPEIETALAGVSPAGRARVWANVAHGRFAVGDPPGAQTAIKLADVALAEIKAPAPMKTPGMAEIHNSPSNRAGVPDSAPLRSAALAAENVAAVHRLLKSDALASESLAASMRFTEGMAPSRTETDRLLKECENRIAMENQLDAALNLKGNRDAKFRAFYQYQQRVTTLAALATERFDLQIAILREAAASGMAKTAWQLMQERETSADAAIRQPFNKTRLPGYVAFQAFVGGDVDTARQIESAFPPQQLPQDPLDLIALRIARARQQGNALSVYEDLRNTYGSPTFDRDLVDMEVLRLVSRQYREAGAVKTLEFAWQLPGESAREDALWLLAAAAVRDGKASDLWKETSALERKLTPPDRAALARGYVAGAMIASKGSRSTSTAALPNQ
ncbi:MAG: hypothetical protein KF774_08425 [Planctomyces sp.]|nr:hypothetical protein [Planctomyces sp.]